MSQNRENRQSFLKTSFSPRSLPPPLPVPTPPTPYCRKSLCKQVLDSNGQSTGELICSPDDDPASMSQCEYIGGNCAGGSCRLPTGTTDTDHDGYDSSVDCNDDVGSINPGADEQCGDDVDNDCDGIKDCADADCALDNLCNNCFPHYHSCTENSNCCDQMVCRGGQCVDADECNPPCTGEQVCFNALCGYTPVIVDVSGDGFKLTDAAHGINFNFEGNGVTVRLPWTKANTDDAWLALDRNGNGRIDNGTELFGSSTPQPQPLGGQTRNGFLALAEYDKAANGGNADGRINPQDAVFSLLRLWQDKNHNGVSEASELHGLSQLNIRTFDLDYKESRRVDQFGNIFKYRAKVKDSHDAQVGRWAYDVFLKPGQ